MTDPDEVARLRRQLRAMATLNEQLRAQIEAGRDQSNPRGLDPLLDASQLPPLGAAPRRARRAQEWLAQPAGPDEGEAYLVSHLDDGVFLIDGGLRRHIRSALVVAGLEGLLGDRRPAGDDEFSAWPEGPPVELLEGPTGLPFLLVGGRRLPVAGLPLPHPVPAELADRLAEGPELAVVAALAGRRAGEAGGWSTALGTEPAAGPTGPPHLVVTESGTFLVEGGRRRAVGSALLVPALEQLVGERTAATDADLAPLADGPPVAVLEGPTGTPFVVVGGRRHPVRGLPLPYQVAPGPADQLSEGPVLDLARAATPRRVNETVGWMAATRAPAGRQGATLVVDADRATWLLEGERKRRVAAALLIPALERLVGSRRRATDQDGLAERAEGAPVEVLEGRSGPPFVVVAGVRHPVRALALPYPVNDLDAGLLPEGPPLELVGELAPRRADQSIGWLAELAAAPSGSAPPAALVVDPENGVWIVEGQIRRRVRSRLLFPIIEQVLGPRRPAHDDELTRPEGPDVELLESRTGPPFLVLAGTRHPVRGMPMPVPVDETGARRLPEGTTLDLGAALTPRRANKAAGALAGPGPATPSGRRAAALVIDADDAAWVVDGHQRRRVRAGLLLPVVEQALGSRRAAHDDELALPEGPDVEVLESRTGLPFLVLAGVRHPLRALPLTVPVDEAAAALLPEGATLDVETGPRSSVGDQAARLKDYLVKKRGG